MNKWDKRFMNLAEEIASWSSCCIRQEGAIIVQDKRIVSTGYNGAPSGVQTCVEKKSCIREERHIPNGLQKNVCYAITAEVSAITSAARLGVEVKEATLYVTHHPDSDAIKCIINAGIKRIVYKYGYADEFSAELLKAAEIQCEAYSDSGFEDENI